MIFNCDSEKYDNYNMLMDNFIWKTSLRNAEKKQVYFFGVTFSNVCSILVIVSQKSREDVLSAKRESIELIYTLVGGQPKRLGARLGKESNAPNGSHMQ